MDVVKLICYSKMMICQSLIATISEILSLINNPTTFVQGTLVTQFGFNVQDLKETEVAAGSGRAPQFDEDGDLVLPRSWKHSYRSESNVVLHIDCDQ